MDKMQVVKLEDIVQEAPHTKTYRFHASLQGKPGQFVMLWIPGYDELPMALSYLGDLQGVTVHAYGEATKALSSFEVGQRVGVRGPYGNYFDLEVDRPLFVAGGTGVASLIAAVEGAAEEGAKVETVIGAKTKDELIFVKRAERAGKVHIATDDGSLGFHGFVPPLAEKIMDQANFDMIITCGPERMMKAVVDAALRRGLPLQASLERFMKCGVGICDACAFDDYLVCLDGPVFTGDVLAKSEDFGRFRRDRCGRRVPI